MHASLISLRAALALSLAIAAGHASIAHADDVGPWSTGVSTENKAAAKALLDEGNRAFVEKDWVRALDKYSQAIGKWDHPAIRFNMVRCLIQLDRVIEANENLAKALQYGPQPLEEAVYAEALAYQKLLANQIADVAVSCSQDGVAITLDGEHLVTCPGSATHTVKPGRHQLVGTKSGFLTQSTEVIVIGGQNERVRVDLAPIPTERRGVIVHRWAAWMPWVVAGAGLVSAGIGGLVEYQAFKDIHEYDHELVAACFDVGCDDAHPVPAPVLDLRARAHTENAIGVAVITLGAATFATGSLLLYLNRARTVYPDIAPRAGGATVGIAGRF